MANKMRFEVLVEEPGDFKETIASVEQRLRAVPGVQNVTLLVAVGDFVSERNPVAEGDAA